MDGTKFDLQLFKQLHEEYSKKPILDVPNLQNDEVRAVKRAQKLNRLIGIENKRVLEVGCGTGHLAYELASTYGAQVLAVDVKPDPCWKELSHPGVEFRVVDISGEHDLKQRRFDAICSWSAMEHVVHPFAMLRTCRKLLAPEGRFFLVAHLYRSATGSHRAREISFPWPHLLFTDDIFEQYFLSEGLPALRPSWVNKLTHAEYYCYFDLLGFVVEKRFRRKRELDVEFYDRFFDELSKYSTFDLTTNAVEVLLSVDRTVKPGKGRSNLSGQRPMKPEASEPRSTATNSQPTKPAQRAPFPKGLRKRLKRRASSVLRRFRSLTRSR